MSERWWNQLDPRIQKALHTVRLQLRLRTGLETILLGLGILFGGFWIGFFVDRIPTLAGGQEMPRSARAMLLIAVLVTFAYLLIKGLREGALRKLPVDRLALLLERRFPQLQGRLLTAVELIGKTDQQDRDFAVPLLQRVHLQAAETIAQVNASDALKWQPVAQKASIALPLIGATLLLVLLAPATARQAFGRLLLTSDAPWPRRAFIEVVGLEVPLTTLDEAGGQRESRLVPFVDGKARIARGEPAALRIRARAENAIVPEVCTVYYRTQSGTRGQANMRRAGRVVDGWQTFTLDGPPFDSITDSLTLEIRGYDARLNDLQIQAIEPPVVQKLELVISPPPYLLEAGLTESIRSFQPGIRVAEGASVMLRGTTTSGLSEVIAAHETVGEPQSAQAAKPLILESGKTFEWRLGSLTKPITARLIPIDTQQVRSPTSYRYLINVAPDLVPDVKVRLKGISDAMTTNAVLPLSGHATDDYGIINPQLVIAILSKEGTGKVEAGKEGTVKEGTDPVSWSRKLVLGRDGAFAERVDLAVLQTQKEIPALLPGTAITLLVEASDAYDLGPQHVGLSDRVRIEVVTPDEMLARLERQELALRSRLQEVIREVQQLRELLDQVRREGWGPSTEAAESSTRFSAVAKSFMQGEAEGEGMIADAN